MTLATIEYTDANQMLADYAARRRRLYEQRPEPIVIPEPVEEPAPPVDPLALYRLAYDSAIDPRSGVQVAKRLIRETAEETGFTVAEIMGEERRAPLARARQLAMWRVSKNTQLSMPRIGNLFGGKDHTTVLHAIRRINEILGENVRDVGGVWRGRKQQ